MITSKRKRKIILKDDEDCQFNEEHSDIFACRKIKRYSLSYFSLDEKVAMSHSVLIENNSVYDVAAAFSAKNSAVRNLLKKIKENPKYFQELRQKTEKKHSNSLLVINNV